MNKTLQKNLEMVVSFKTEDLLEEAHRRVLGMREVKGSMKDGKEAAILESLEEAKALVLRYAKPGGYFKKIAVSSNESILEIENVSLDNAHMAEKLKDSRECLIYMVSLCYDTRDVMAEVKEDYGLYMFHHYLGRTMLFMAGQELHKLIQKKESKDWKRVAFLENSVSLGTGEDTCSVLWDASAIGKLFPLFLKNSLGVSITEAGCLNPLYSLMGMMYEKKRN